MRPINPHLLQVTPNPAFHIGAKVHGRADVIHLEFGEPDFPTPEHIVAAAIRSIADERQGYSPAAGFLWLREAIADRASRVAHIPTVADRVLVTAGGTGALLTALLVLCSPGDEILVPDPAWAGYEGIVATAGARLVRYRLDASQDWQPDRSSLERVVTPATRILLVNSPSNPGGSVYSSDTIAMLMEFAGQHDLWVVSDECYDEIIFEGEHHSPAAFDDDDRVLTVGTCSKSYAMTGWRVGWVNSPRSLVRPLSIALAAQINNLPLFIQRAAEAALTGPQQCVREMLDAYRMRRDLALSLLRPGLPSISAPAGAFYLLVPAAALTGVSEGEFNSVRFAEQLIDAEQVAVAPGIAFGPNTAGYVRLSLASSEAALSTGIERLAHFATSRSDQRQG